MVSCRTGRVGPIGKAPHGGSGFSAFRLWTVPLASSLGSRHGASRSEAFGAIDRHFQPTLCSPPFIGRPRRFRPTGPIVLHGTSHWISNPENYSEPHTPACGR